MVQRVQVVALAASLAIGAAVVAGLTLGSGEAPVHVGPTTMSASDQVEIYAAILMHLAARPDGTVDPARAIQVSRTIYDTCMPRPTSAREEHAPESGPIDPHAVPPTKSLPAPCGRAKVGRLKPDIEAALRERLARQGTEARFGEEGEYSLHQIVTEATGTPAADGDDVGRNIMKFHFKRVGGLWQLQGTTVDVIFQ